MAPFIPNLSAMSEPLRNLLKKDTDFQWSSSHSTSFESIKQAICQEVSLTYFDPKKETVIQVDASLLKKHWNLMKYPQGLGRSLELIWSSGKEMNIC